MRAFCAYLQQDQGQSSWSELSPCPVRTKESSFTFLLPCIKMWNKSELYTKIDRNCNRLASLEIGLNFEYCLPD